MANINHQIGVKTDLNSVLSALTTIQGLSQWWTSETEGNAEEGGKIRFLFNGAGPEVNVRKVSNRGVEWRCIAGPDEWMDTDIVFDLENRGDETAVYFQHRNWKSETPFLSHCSMKWAVFMLSLKNYLETGTGNAFPNDIAIEASC